MLQVAQGTLYRVLYESRGYEYEDFVYREDLIDALEVINEKGKVLKVIVEEE